MARAMARGWGDPVLCSDGGSGRAQALADELGGQAASNAEVAAEADLVILCHKPYQLGTGRERDLRQGDGRGVGAGRGPQRDAAVRLHGRPGVPHGPQHARRGAARGQRVCAALGSSGGYAIDHDLERDVIALFERLGTVITLDESLLGVALGVSSVGPAYQALLLEAQVDAAVRRGIKPALAAQLVAETMSGTAELLRRRDYDTLAVRREVTSPAGSTARGLDALERAGIRAAFSDAMNAVLEVAT